MKKIRRIVDFRHIPFFEPSPFEGGVGGGQGYPRVKCMRLVCD